MGNPNPFYRFQQGWNAGFYPDNQIVSDLLNEIYLAVTTAYPSWVTYGVTTIGQLKSLVNNLVQPYNAHPYYGNFSVNVDLVVGPIYNFILTVRDNGLYAIDNSQEISISGTASNPGKVIATSALNAFVVGSYTGTFDATLVEEEEKAREALNVVNFNGSAIFPQTYIYNSTTGVATSGLARAKDLQLINGSINRLPADTVPRKNRRIFQLPELTGDDKYVITLMDSIIQASLIDPDYNTSIFPLYNSIIVPDTWLKNINNPSYLTYERVEITFTDPARRQFTLIGRKDNNSWLWQRFVSVKYIITFSWLDIYSETTPLPYEPNQAGRWLYVNDNCDFEFVDFTPECFVSEEFYPMPAKPGDNFQFNVIDANLTGLNQVNVGLFTESGQFVQKIGEANRLNYLCDEEVIDGDQFGASVIIPSAKGCYRMGMYNDINSSCELTFTYQITAENLEAYLGSVNSCFETLDKRIYYSNGLDNYSFELTKNTYTAQDLADWANQNIPGMNAIVSYCFAPSAILCLTYTWTFEVECGQTEYIMSNGNGNGQEIVSVFWQTDNQNCVCNTTDSLYSLSNIINIDASDCFSTILEFWADSNSIAEGMEYYSDWKQRIRIGLNGGGEKPIIEESLYRQSNGVHRRPQNKQDLSLDLHTDFFDLDTQLAMTDATRHPYLIWEGKSIFVKGDIEVATTQDFTTQSSFETLSQMKFQALIQGFQPRNSSCLTC